MDIFLTGHLKGYTLPRCARSERLCGASQPPRLPADSLHAGVARESGSVGKNWSLGRQRLLQLIALSPEFGGVGRASLSANPALIIPA